MKSHRDLLRYSRKKRTQKKRKRLVLYAGASSFAVIIVVALLLWGAHSERVRISDVLVSGNTVVQTEDITRTIKEELAGSYLFLFPKDNTFIYPKERIRNGIIARNKRISSVSIQRNTLRGLSVYVTEYKPAYLWCDTTRGAEQDEENSLDKNCYFADNQGYIYAKAPYFSGYVFFQWRTPKENPDPVGTHVLKQKTFESLVAFKDALQGLGFEPIALRLEGTRDYALLMKDGSTVFFGKEQDPQVLLDNIDSILDILPNNKTLDYIDLRFGNKVFYK